MCFGEVECPGDHEKLFKSNEGLRNKLVLHRGYHSIDAGYSSRPWENTRQAYSDAARSGGLFAECDVWTTKDDVLVLCHNSTFESAAETDERRAVVPIAELEWAELVDLKLKDGSTPVMLDTVLEDLQGTQMRLVIELKTSAAAPTLGAHLAKRKDLADRVAWVMSFSFAAVEHFLESGGKEAGCRGTWILDNPNELYDRSTLDEGETTFDCSEEDVGTFLNRVGLKDRFQHLRFGMYLQYNPAITPLHVLKLRTDLDELFGPPAGHDNVQHRSFVGLWSDISLDPLFDTVSVMSEWVDVVDAINSDLPHAFWLSSVVPEEQRYLASKTHGDRARLDSASTTASGDEFDFSRQCSLDSESTEVTPMIAENGYDCREDMQPMCISVSA